MNAAVHDDDYDAAIAHLSVATFGDLWFRVIIVANEVMVDLSGMLSLLRRIEMLEINIRGQVYMGCVLIRVNELEDEVGLLIPSLIDDEST